MLAECGTEQAYNRHRAQGETPCALCRRAAADARRDRRYGLEPGTYDRMYETQAGRCYICGGEHPKGKLVVDHCHATGDVRHLLCNFCNKGIGLALESTAILRRMTLYLEGNLAAAPTAFLAPEKLTPKTSVSLSESLSEANGTILEEC